MSADGTASAGRGQQPILASQREKAETKSKEPRGTARFNGYFPLGYKAAVSQWWQSVTPAMAEHNVLSFIPYLKKPPTHTQTGTATSGALESTIALDTDSSSKAQPVQTTTSDPHGPRSWHSNMVPLSGKNRAINEFSVERTGETVEENLVMLHGYGAGLGFFYKNFEGLSRVPGWKVYALDMLGMGRSTRPAFKVHAKDQAGKIAEAESWFIDSLEEWRKIRKIEKFTLLGHSMGGYMAVAYALKYPGRLNKLILASPVGIPEDPYSVQAEMPPEESEPSALANEFLQDQEETSSKPKAQNVKKGKDVAPKRPIPGWVSYLWEANISPFSIVRWAGPLGPRFVSGWTSRRFSHLPEDESRALHDYAYSLFRQRGSGEYALAYILAPGAFARSPLIRRIQGVGRQPLPTSTSTPTSTNTKPTDDEVKSTLKEMGIPVVLMYGENDWMDVAGGYAAEQKIKEEKERVLANASPEERKRDRGGAKVVIIKKAGHHVYLDGAEQFDQVMRQEMEETSRHTKEDRL